MNNLPACHFCGRFSHLSLQHRPSQFHRVVLKHWRGCASARSSRIKAASKDEPNLNGGTPKRALHSFSRSEGLPLSLYTPFKVLPPDGKTLTESEESCDPMERKCKTPAHVYEAQCALCDGTGVVISRGKGHGKKRPSTCMQCSGLGYVRRTTSRFVPEVNCVGPNLTINRPGLNNGRPTPIKTFDLEGDI